MRCDRYSNAGRGQRLPPALSPPSLDLRPPGAIGRAGGPRTKETTMSKQTGKTSGYLSESAARRAKTQFD